MHPQGRRSAPPAAKVRRQLRLAQSHLVEEAFAQLLRRVKGCSTVKMGDDVIRGSLEVMEMMGKIVAQPLSKHCSLVWPHSLGHDLADESTVGQLRTVSTEVDVRGWVTNSPEVQAMRRESESVVTLDEACHMKTYCINLRSHPNQYQVSPCSGKGCLNTLPSHAQAPHGLLALSLGFAPQAHSVRARLFGGGPEQFSCARASCLPFAHPHRSAPCPAKWTPPACR